VTEELIRKIYVASYSDNLSEQIELCLRETGILDRITGETRIAIKQNFTYPYYKPGVTTSPEVIRETVRILHRFTPHIAIVETDGGYHAWQATEAFKGHRMYDLEGEFGVEIVNLCDEDRQMIAFRSRGREYRLPLPVRLLHETDLLITMPVPKVHAMTGLTLAYKNQWGCIPDIMRLRRHYIFHDAIVAINRALKPVVLSDGTYFLDDNGPMEGTSVRMNLVIGATDAGTFDRYMSEMMGWSYKKIKHLRSAVKAGDMPAELNKISFNIPPTEAMKHVFRLRRGLRNFVALVAFKSRLLTWLGYESWFGRVILHAILYAIVGQPSERTTERSVLEKPD
jgi:uncharacterized protein (DUF362 family)